MSRRIESPVVLINHWRWLEANGYKQQAASCKRQAASLTRKHYNDIGDNIKEKEIMKTKEALKIIGGSLSKPSKMPGWSIGLPAKECKTGGKLQKVPGSVCFDCYALKGCYVFKVVQDAQYRRLAALKSPDWVQAMAHLINSKKPDVFRWHDSGDVQDLDHLQKIYEVCRLTPSKRHWLPTREAWIKDHLQDKPNNLVIRFSAPMVNQRAPASWPNSSEVVDSRGQLSSC
jgi:hypothetical protein